MKAKVVKTIQIAPKSNSRASRAYLITLKDEKGSSWKCWTDDSLGNFRRWYEVVLALLRVQKAGDELWLVGLHAYRGAKNLVDADSCFSMEIVIPTPEQKEITAREAVETPVFVPPPAPEERHRKDLHD